MTSVDRIRFFHSFQLPNGTILNGKGNLEMLQKKANVIFKSPLQGKTVLDVGAWDGFFSFEAERRGAKRVLATDHFCWSGPGWGSKAGFDYIHNACHSKIDSLDVDVFDLDPNKQGIFDVVLFLGVLYHLKNPVGGLEKVAAMTRDLLVIETIVDLDDISEPAARYYVAKELNSDHTNFWGPNTACVEGMLRDIGFSRFEFWKEDPSKRRTRLIVHAWR